jgi:hypothetical protein
MAAGGAEVIDLSSGSGSLQDADIIRLAVAMKRSSSIVSVNLKSVLRSPAGGRTLWCSCGAAVWWPGNGIGAMGAATVAESLKFHATITRVNLEVSVALRVMARWIFQSSWWVSGGYRGPGSGSDRRGADVE